MALIPIDVLDVVSSTAAAFSATVEPSTLIV